MSEIDLTAQAAEFDAHLEGKVAEKQEPTAKVEAHVAEPVAKAVESDTFDINSLPPAAKAQWEATQKRLQEIEERNRRLDTENRSFRGKTPHLESKVARLERELRERAPAAQSSREVRPGVAQSPQGQKPASTLQALPGWPKLRQVFQEDAAPIEEAFTALETHNQKLAERLEQSEARMAKMEELLEKDVRPRIKDVDDLRAEREALQYRTVEQEITTGRDTITKNYPDWQSHIEHTYDPETNEITNTQVSSAMKGWLESMPEKTRQYYEDIFFEGHPKDVEWALGQFYATLKQAPDPNAAKVAQLNTRRQENLRNQVAPAAVSGAPRMDAGDLTDADQFDAFLAERERRLRK